VESYQLVFSVHAGLRMSKWSIDEEDVQTVVDTGEVIEEYSHALPLPCQLMIRKGQGSRYSCGCCQDGGNKASYHYYSLYTRPCEMGTGFCKRQGDSGSSSLLGNR
jgi:hypothetical protein